MRDTQGQRERRVYPLFLPFAFHSPLKRLRFLSKLGGLGGGASIYTAAVSLGLVFSCLIPLAVQLGAQFLKMGFLTGG